MNLNHLAGSSGLALSPPITFNGDSFKVVSKKSMVFKYFKASLVLMGLSLLIPAHGQSRPIPEQPLLIQLFVSQGCSSCPPAGDLVNGWGMELFRAGKALPLAFHVDYWDYLGWKDPFSSSFFTERQRQYSSALSSSSLYTPEMVVSGRSGFVASDGARAHREIEEPDNLKASARVVVAVSPVTGGMALKIKLQPLAGSQTGGPWKVMMAVFENNLITHVESGENKGRDLTENFVVRSVVGIRSVSLKKAEWIKTTVSLEPEWKKSFTGLAIFLEDEYTMKIGGVGWVYPIVP